MNIDTLSIARDLKATELPAAQAEAIAAAIGRATSENVATKGDIDIVNQRMEAMEARLSAKIEGVRSSMLIWLVSTIVTAVGVLIAVIKL